MKNYLSFAAFSLAVSVALPALSEDNLKNENQFNEVVVTAALSPINPYQSGSAISVITAEDIEATRATIVSDLLRSVPGVAVSRNGVLGSSTQLRMRGAEANHVLVMIDGIEVNDPSQGDEFNWAHLSAAGVERIEVVRGPQSSLWGSDALAGVVNIITRKSDEPFQGSVYSEAGSYNTSNSGFQFGGKGETYQVNLTGSHISSNGDNVSRQGSEEDGYRNSTLNLNVGWQPLENLALSLIGRQTEGENEFDEIDFGTGLPADAANESEFRQRFVKVKADLSLLDGRWDHRLSAAISRHGNENFDATGWTGSSVVRKKQYSYLTTYKWAEDSQRISLLAERETEDFSQRGIVQFFGDPNQDRSRESDSLALEYRVTLWDDLTLAASVRQDDNSEFDDSETHQLQASYAIPDTGTRFRASYGTAVKNPTFTERYGFYTNFQGNQNLEPEESKSWEVGIDQTLLEGDLILGLTYFKAKLENEINGFVYDPNTFAFTADNVDGRSDRQGIEASIDANLSDSLTLQASYTYTDSTETDSATGDDVDELRRAKHLASASLNWSATDELRFALSAQYNGVQDDKFFPPWPLSPEVIEMDDYTLVNLTASYQVSKGLSVYTRLENILDEDYEEVFGFQTLGFGGHVGVRYSFAQ